MKKFLAVSLTLLLFSCDNSTNSIQVENNVNLVPVPKELTVFNELLLLTRGSALYSNDARVQPYLEIFSSEIRKLTGIIIGISENLTTDSDIVFQIDTSLAKDEYSIEVTDYIDVNAGSYQSLTMAGSTLLQLVTVENGLPAFPVLSIYDKPDSPYRGLMIDLARQWHSMKTIKKIINLAAYYKTNYLHLHFSDYQSYTLPSKAYPKLSTPIRHYTFDQLKDIEEYSQLRGVTIIPEIDIPGHSSPFVLMYPEIFAISDVDENPWIINMGKEQVYEALDIIIGEISEIFTSTPYIHIGGDEAIFHMVTNDPEVQQYMADNQLGDDVHELYRHFLVRMNNIVKSYNKQMCVWEGFRPDGEVEIPKDIIVFEFETNRYLPNLLVEDGYTLVNTSWKPLYVVNSKKWEPETIYKWNVWRWENWFPKAPSFQPIQLDSTSLIIGAEMCAWEQSDNSEIPSLRKRLPVMNERICNVNKVVDYDQFIMMLDATDNKLSLLISDTTQDKLLFNYNFEKEN